MVKPLRRRSNRYFLLETESGSLSRKKRRHTPGNERNKGIPQNTECYSKQRKWWEAGGRERKRRLESRVDLLKTPTEDTKLPRIRI